MMRPADHFQLSSLPNPLSKEKRKDKRKTPYLARFLPNAAIKRRWRLSLLELRAVTHSLKCRLNHDALSLGAAAVGDDVLRLFARLVRRAGIEEAKQRRESFR